MTTLITVFVFDLHLLVILRPIEFKES